MANVTIQAAPRAFYGWRVVAALAVTQTVGYGVLFYAFAVVLTPMHLDLGLSTAQISGALTFGLLVSAVAAVPVGRWVDRHGGRALMTLGSVAGTALVVAWSQVQSVLQLYLVFAGMGLAYAAVLYEPAFAVIVPWFRHRRGTALLAVTIVAGFASTIFMPLTGWLTESHGWRDALLTLAVVHGVTTVPLHLALRRPGDLGQHTGGADERPPETTAVSPDRAAILRAAYRDPFFRLLGIALVVHSLTTAILSIHLVSYLIGLGHPTARAATVVGLLGLLSVTGRLVTASVARRFPLTTVTAVIFAVQAVAAAALPSVGASTAGAVMCVLGIGLGFGVVSIIKPALLAEQYDITAFGTLSGVMMLPMTLAKAVGPFAATAVLVSGGSYTWVIVLVVAALLVSSLAIFATGRHYTPAV